MSRRIIIKSHNGIGDMLFATPSFKVIKEAYLDCHITINTNRAEVIRDNPYVDEVGGANTGLFLGYPAPDGGKLPTQHHIISDWQLICNAFDLKTEPPELRPDIYYKPKIVPRSVIAVQCDHKRNYHSKRVWPHFEALAEKEGFERIPHFDNPGYLYKLMDYLASCSGVVCAEGGISHLSAGLGGKAVVLFGGFSDPVWTGYDDHINLVSNVACKHCFNNSPCRNGFICWDSLSMDVIETIARGNIDE